MALDYTQQARVDAINTALRDDRSGKKLLLPGERTALRAELTGIFAGDAAPTPQVDERVAALAARADRLNGALHGYNWTAPDRRLLSDALAETTLQLPDGAWVTPALPVTAPARAALLPAGLTGRLGDKSLPAAERDSALADLDTTLDGLMAPPGAGGGGAAHEPG